MPESGASPRGATHRPTGGELECTPSLRRGNDLLTPLVKDLLSESQPVCLEVDGHSMTPFIRRGDLVTVRPRRASRPALGDVLLVAADARRFTIHRYVDHVDGCVVPRGDCAPTADPPTPIEEVLGFVTRVEREGRRVWAGLGPERRTIAWLSRTGLLWRVARWRARFKAS